MSNVHYVCLSDLHFGEEDSLMTWVDKETGEMDPKQVSPVMEQFVNCLKTLLGPAGEKGSKPTLILNGDMLELALCDTHEAAMAFKVFMDLIMPQDGELFSEVIVIPGNHDHHLWEIARETQYVEYLRSPKGKKQVAKDGLPKPYHVTTLFPRANELPGAYLLDQVVGASGTAGPKIRVAYPNFGVRSDSSNCLIFHHGHFTEWIYSFMSTLKEWFVKGGATPADVMRDRKIWDLEAENFAWIDFAWSALGRSGSAGQELETIYEKSEDPRALNALISNLADGISTRVLLNNRISDWFEAGLMKKAATILLGLFGVTERGHDQCPLSEEGLRTLFSYVEGPLRQQIQVSLNIKEGKALPQMTFVFGHTHKPFVANEPFGGGYGPNGVDVYNTGGWVVDTLVPDQCHGAAMVLVDEAFNVVSLRLYNEPYDGTTYPVRVQQGPLGASKGSQFRDDITSSIEQNKALWDEFTSIAASEVGVRRKFLKKRVLSNL